MSQQKKEEWKAECYGDELREKILEFAEAGYDSIPEDEREAWFSRFKFWGLFHQRDGQEGYFMLRLANADGVLDPGQMRAIAEVAREFAHGPATNPEFGDAYIDFTTRQSIQMHWLRLEDIPEIWDRLESVGVSSRSSGGDTMRNISGCPLAGKGEEYVETLPLLERFQEDLRGDDSLSNLPRKFNISVTGCHEGCAQDSINDIGLEPAHREVDGEETRGFNVRVGGGLGGRQPRRARSLDTFVTPEEGYDVVRAFVELYHEAGDRERRARNRARFFVDEEGVDWIRDEVASRVDFDLRPAGEDFRERYTYNAGKPAGAGRADHVGVHDQADGEKYVGLSVPVGRMGADAALELARLAETYGTGEVRLTRRQNPVLVDVAPEDVADLLAEPLLEKYPAEPNPFDRGAIACTGTEFCPLALTETKARMARMLRWLAENITLPDDVEHLHVHYSGCTADCGQAMTADIGLQGMRARKDGEMVEALDLGVGGGIGEEPTFVDWVHQRVPADEAPAAIRSLVEAFAAHRTEGQSFREWVGETGTETLVDLCEPAETDYTDPWMHDAKQSWYPFAEEEQAPSAGEVVSDD